jgi:hypothetical protein
LSILPKMGMWFEVVNARAPELSEIV